MTHKTKKRNKTVEEVSDKFIILKSSDTGENNKLLSLFCEGLGKVRAVGRGVRSSKAKLKFLNLPFCVCDGVLFKNGTSYLVKTAKVIHSFLGITQSAEKFEAGNIILETLLKFDSLDKITFARAVLALEYIESVENGEKLFALKFLIDLLFSNFNLNFNCCNICGETANEQIYLNFSSGELLCGDCKTNNAVQIKHLTASTVDKIYNLEYSELVNLNLEKSSIDSLCLFISELVKGLTEINLNSLKNRSKM